MERQRVIAGLLILVIILAGLSIIIHFIPPSVYTSHSNAGPSEDNLGGRLKIDISENSDNSQTP